MNCWICGGPTEQIYSVSQIPTSSVALHTSRRAAMSSTRGDLELVVCGRCGFIQNSAFDPALVPYDAPYEPSQAASAVFRAFATETIDRLVNRHHLEGSVVLEVGCGKAEWLAMCCRLGRMTGIGIDPAYEPGQVPGEDLGSFEVQVGLFGPDSGLTGDLVACRHTLEHLPNPVEFTSWLVDAALRTPGSVMYVEVPDASRILQEGAFWDVYYEHCSYFTPTSLAGLAAAAGIETISVQTGYSGQYLMLEGRPGGTVEIAGDGREVVVAARTFRELADETIDWWRKRVMGENRIALWAATSKTVGFIEATGITPVCVVDINPVKWGSYLAGSGVEIISPATLDRYRPDVVIAMNPIYLDEIQTVMRAEKVDASLLGLGPAPSAGATVGGHAG